MSERQTESCGAHALEDGRSADRHALQAAILQAVALSALASLAMLLLAEPALAQATSSGGYQTVLSAVRGFLKFLTGPFGKAIASIGLIICGIGWVAGKMNIAWLLYVVVGAAIIFGAEQIIDSIASGGGQL